LNLRPPCPQPHQSTLIRCDSARFGAIRAPQCFSVALNLFPGLCPVDGALGGSRSAQCDRRDRSAARCNRQSSGPQRSSWLDPVRLLADLQGVRRAVDDVDGAVGAVVGAGHAGRGRAGADEQGGDGQGGRERGLVRARWDPRPASEVGRLGKRRVCSAAVGSTKQGSLAKATRESQEGERVVAVVVDRDRQPLRVQVARRRRCRRRRRRRPLPRAAARSLGRCRWRRRSPAPPAPPPGPSRSLAYRAAVAGLLNGLRLIQSSAAARAVMNWTPCSLPLAIIRSSTRIRAPRPMTSGWKHIV